MILPYATAPSHPSLQDLRIPARIHRSPRAVLLLHGFSGTPEELRSLAQVIPEEWDLFAPVLPGHGGLPYDLSPIRYRAWIESAQSAYRELRRSATWVGVVGLSMGGALAQCLFGEDPPPDRVVLMATPDRIEDRKGKWILPLIRHLRLRRRWIYLKERGSDIALAEERERIVNYRWVPLESLSELDALLKRVQRNRCPAPVPTLILHGIHDHTAPFSHALRLRRELGRSATLIALPRSYHVLTRDREKEDLARVTLAFLEGTPPSEIPLPRGWVRYPPVEEPPAR